MFCVLARHPLFCVSQRTDEEAVVDRGGTRSMLNTNFEKEELEGKCQDSITLFALRFLLGVQ